MQLPQHFGKDAMKHVMLSAAAIALALGLAACERETRTVERNTGTTVVQPKETVKEKETVVTPSSPAVKEKETVVVTPPSSGASGPAGPQGAQGDSGKTETKKE
jgi:hypothetical protein